MPHHLKQPHLYRAGVVRAAALSDARTPAAGAGCAACHGQSLAHRSNPAGAAPDVAFGGAHASAAAAQDAACLGCHHAQTPHWSGGAHAVDDVPCSGCHRLHARVDPVTRPAQQAEVCVGCHARVRAEMHLPSRHALAEGQLRCTDCHAAHGSLKPAELTGINLNETCLRCHAELRGPFLFDHPPAADDCGICHRPHGSVYTPLLVARGPQLCQDCHQAAFHPSNLNAGGGLPSATPNASLLARNCLNCHPKIHGTNHPSGARLTR
jgi:DmsE family decaheme c-type cytochrome